MPSQAKKRLWRYASKNCGETCDGTNPSSSKYGYNGESYIDETCDDEEYLQSKRERSRSPVHSALAPTSVMTTFATTAANIIRKCCCGVGVGATVPNNNNEKTHGIINTHCPNVQRFQMNTKMQEQFHILMKNLRRRQDTALYLAVRSRLENLATHPSKCPQVADCILVPRSPNFDEEPHVITCRLFFWKELKNATQLKRLPNCPSENDGMYVCCNPLHWGRILETGTDIAPPPYRRAATESEDFSFRESSQEGENSITKSLGFSSLSSSEMLPNIRVRIPESVTTDGENCGLDPTSWCKVAYWELKQRVGEFHFAKKPSVNICLSSAYCKGEMSEEVNLHKLFDARKTPSERKVQSIRQKIGLGIALSDESNGVWLFNRSIEPIFVHSPTLCASWFQVCKVLPGDCLMAFDYKKARELKDPSQLPGAQAGPVDKYSMRISFVKGYGITYKRQDVFQCPCWVEVHFIKR